MLWPSRPMLALKHMTRPTHARAKDDYLDSSVNVDCPFVSNTRKPIESHLFSERQALRVDDFANGKRFVPQNPRRVLQSQPIGECVASSEDEDRRGNHHFRMTPRPATFPNPITYTRYYKANKSVLKPGRYDESNPKKPNRTLLSPI